MRLLKISAFCLAFLLALAPLDAAFAQLAGTGDFHIAWEVKSRFRLFRHEADFLRMAAATRGDGVLAAERRLARDRLRVRKLGGIGLSLLWSQRNPYFLQIHPASGRFLLFHIWVLRRLIR